MTSILTGDGFCYIDESKLWEDILESKKLNPDFFAINDQFKMDSQVKAEKSGIYRATRKRKNGGASFLGERGKLVQEVFQKFINTKEIGILVEAFEGNKVINNEEAKLAAKSIKEFGWIQRCQKRKFTQMKKFNLSDNESVELWDNDTLCNFENKEEKETIINAEDSQFLIPKKSSFIVGPVAESSKQLDFGEYF